VVVVTGRGSLDTAVAALRAGASDFITKPLDLTHLALTIEREIRNRALRDEVKRLRQAVDASKTSPEIVGESAAVRRVHDLIRRVAPTEASVLVIGESGTGKELIARALHDNSARSAGPFVAVNCAAVPEALLESELFGHARGAFTDARHSRQGLFQEASGGTIFLDEIGEMPIALQPKLLRALQERTIRPVGANSEIPIDVRIVAATNRDLESAVEEGRFRQDLFYRLNVISLEVPPLRARGNDVLILAQTFIRRFAVLTEKRVEGMLSATAEKLLAYDWPGNVRELQNCIERAVTLTDFDKLSIEDLPERVRQYSKPAPVSAVEDPGELVTMEEVERRYIRRVMEAVGGNKTMAAKLLGYDRKTLYRKLAAVGEPSAET
jgi:DNA-binding NtrC family response regulator